MSLTIRLARAEDYEDVARLQRQVAQLHHDWRPDIYRPAQKYDQTRYEELLANPDTPILVAEKGEKDMFCSDLERTQRSDGAPPQVAGYVLLRVITPQNPVQVQRSFMHIDDLCVDETCRRQGVGEALMCAVMELARERELDAVELGVWECNEAARAFYKQLGFVVKTRSMEMKL
ncbi:MAG: GNAT family N-acetyltransferase [Oscillospiraceae bacterium]|nr:GNAT family N-acetyltransferase [Oscillospiraceae bacterium]